MLRQRLPGQGLDPSLSVSPAGRRTSGVRQAGSFVANRRRASKPGPRLEDEERRGGLAVRHPRVVSARRQL